MILYIKNYKFNFLYYRHVPHHKKSKIFYLVVQTYASHKLNYNIYNSTYNAIKK